jgi:MFS family permease
LSRLSELFRHRDYGLLVVVSGAMTFAGAMIGVAVGWQVYDIHQSAFDLGLVGLAEFVPLPLLALPSGHLSDRLPRRLVLAGALLLETAVAVLLLVVSSRGASQLWPFLVLASAAGVASALGTPPARALLPTLVPPELVEGAVAFRSVVFQIATVSGPAIGGLLFALHSEAVYGVAAALFLLALACVLALHTHGSVEEHAGRPVGLESLLGGIRFIRRTPVLLGAITLDLFAVLFGGAVALLPLFARSVLDVGPTGLGILRSAPSAGAVVAAILLSRRPLGGRIGRTLLVSVAVFGASIVVFGLSRSFALSLVALTVSGFADMISVNIRATTVAIATPNELRGRVNAVELVFIGASNELGAFESGAAAALVGAVPAVVAGGVLTIALAAVWPWVFRPLAEVDRYEQLRPEATRV